MGSLLSEYSVRQEYFADSLNACSSDQLWRFNHGSLTFRGEAEKSFLVTDTTKTLEFTLSEVEGFG